MIHSYSGRLGDKKALLHNGLCPHCNNQSSFDIYVCHSTFDFLKLPTYDVMLCHSCQKFSRFESMLNKVVNVIASLPFLVLSVIVFCVAIYMFYSLFATSGNPLGMSIIPVILIVVSCFIMFKLVHFLKRSTFNKGLVPLAGIIHTKM